MAAARMAKTALVAAAAGWLGICGLLFFAQDTLVFHPRAGVARTPADIGLKFEDLTIDTADGETLGAWLVPADDGRGTVIFSHGNAGNIGGRLGTIEILHELGLDVLIYDYRGFGTSTGAPGEDGLYADALAVWRFLVEDRGVDPARVVIMGRSLGGAVAVWLASQVEAGALIVESSFTSAVDLGQQRYWFAPVRWLARHKFESIERIATVGEPVLVAHSEEDGLIPVAHARALFEAASEPRQFLQLRGGHNDAFASSGAVYRDGLDAFLTGVLGPCR